MESFQFSMRICLDHSPSMIELRKINRFKITFKDIYYMKLNLTLVSFIVLLFVGQVTSIARAPSTFCQTKRMINQFPLASGELLIRDSADFFSGYNLKVTLGSNNSWAAVSQKWHMLEQRNQYFPNIISHYIEPKDNSVGRDSFLLYKDLTGSTLISYGIIQDKKKLPEVNSTAIVTTDKDVVCFDAALFLDHGLAVVDCAKKSGSIISSYRNYFYIIDLTNHSLKKLVENDLYVSFREITRRKLMKFSHPQAGGFTYLLRSHFSDGVDAAHSDNTYMEIFIVPVEDPTEIEPLRVIDRTFLNVKALRIMDAEIYLDDIFLLDYDTGLFRIDILQSQRVEITGRYRDYGFVKFGVYSNDLQDELIIALANKHSVYEIDWHIMSKPTLINKYSLMENSRIKQIFLNDQYLIVQSAADAFNATHPKFEIDYTWVFSKGSRTYLNAYHVINHNSSIVEIQFDRDNSCLYIADEKGLSLREIGEAKVIMHYLNESQYGKTEDIVVFADSFDFYSNETFRCQLKLTVNFVSKENTTIFPTGINLDTYSVNYPNPLEIPLFPYFYGPDIQYSVLNSKGDALPSSWINKLNKTKFSLTPKPTLDIVFFHSDVVYDLGHDLIIYFYQDSANNTHVAQCQHFWASTSVDCNVRRSYNHTSRIRSFTSSYFTTNNGYKYLYSMVFEGENKAIYIYDFTANKLVAEIVYQGDYEAEVTQIATSNGFLYALRKYAKTIDVYSLSKCIEFSTCKPDFSISYATLKALGIRYFSPEKIVTDTQHPEVIFIQCLGSLIILDIDNKEKIHLLDEIVSIPTGIRNYQIAVSKTRLLIAAYPNHLYIYSLEHLYTYNMVSLLRTLSTYGMNLQPNADIQFSDADSIAYVNAVDPVKNVSVVLIYRTNEESNHARFATVVLDQLYSRPGFQIEVSGVYVNYMTIVTGSQFQVYLVFKDPFLTIAESSDDFSFKIQAYNQNSTLVSNQVNVSVVNQPQIIAPTKEFNDTNGNITAADVGNYEWQDREWFTGNIMRYNYTCDDCHKGGQSKVRLREHIDNFEDLHVGGNYYTETLLGGIAVYDDLFRFRPNGSVWEISTLPDQKQLEKCSRVAAAENEIFAVTACQELGRGVNLYITSFSSYKSFTWGPYYSDAYNIRNLQIINDILMVVDTASNPENQYEQGAIYLYRLSFNAESNDEMDELEVIDSNDFVGIHGWTDDKAFLGNAHIVYAAPTNTYRLYITEARYGFFVIDFVKAHVSDAEITILTTSFVNVRQLLQDVKIHIPNDASFQAISYVKSNVIPHFDSENIVITMKGFDNFEIMLIYDEDGRLQTQVLHRIYKRYAFYNTFNEVHARNGFIVVGYIFPPNMVSDVYRKQYIALYDSIDYPHESEQGYSEHEIISAIPLDTTTAAMFAINTTYDFHSNGTRSGIVISLPQDHRLIGASIAHNLTLSLTKGYKTQDISIKAFNDFSSFNFTASVTAKPDDDSSESTIIIIIIILCAIVFVFFLFYIFSIARKKKQPTEERESLITQNQNIGRESVAQNIEAYQPPVAVSNENVEVMRRQESDESGEEEEEEEEAEAEVEEEEQVEVSAPKAEAFTSLETASVEPQSVVVLQSEHSQPEQQRPIEEPKVQQVQAANLPSES